ncbi:C-type lectin domain family 4 member C-like [Xyrichtys novacula]|uniref:C-type lectin domain family 4 member C-like n=1 Tax=Xyrichtys novacula TaxID=13765 RepID=A0AAV1FPI8_XYRNO|nr:C-type lectin domain family 4 member C-like [Xyrichtys novacula]
MEEEIHHSAVVFKNRGPAEREREEKGKGAAAASPSARPHFCVLSVCLGVVCVLLVSSVGAIIHISAVMNEQKANLQDLRAEIQQLITERSICERETEQLSRVAGNYNRTLEVIMEFDTFPVKEFCPEKKCQPCQRGWVQFQGKCYLFYEKNYPWLTWQDSRTYCQDEAGDLVVVNNPQEQEFISRHIHYYHDTYHGYWLGLQKSDTNRWQWVDGHYDTLGYWTEKGSQGPCGLMIPNKSLTASWYPAKCYFWNKFICESEALIWSHV